MIESSADGRVRVVTIDRPERRNALTREGLDQLRTAIDTATEPVVYLHGAGDAFCAGADLNVVRELDGDEAAKFARRGQRVAETIADTDTVVVAGIDGPARGGGVELALACDIRVGTPAATLAETGVALGLFGAWGGTPRLPDVVGLGNALDIGLSGREIDAETALRMGLLSRIVDDPRSVATEIADHDARALTVIKERLRDTASSDQQEKREAEAFAELVDAAEFE